MMQENMAKQEQNGIEKMVMTLSLLIGGMMIAHLCIDSYICVAILLGIMTLGLCAISFFKVSEYPVRTMINSFILAGIVIVYNLCADNVSYGMPLFFALSALAGLYGVSRNLIPMMLTTFVLIGFYMTEGIPATEYITSIVLSLVFEFVLYVWLRGREKMQRLSRQMIQALRMAERTKDEFLSNVSHELRTPLNTISGMSDLIADEEDRKKIHEHAEAIQTASRYLAQIVGNMLDFSEMQSGNIELKESNYYISDIVDEIQSIAELQKGDKDINILTDVDNTMPCLLKGDMNRIVCICMNLVGNAVKFTERGYIRIRVGGEYEGDQWTLRLAVEDSGVGMVPEQMAKMLCGNNQPDSNANRKSSGIGLGLPIVQVLLKKMKGELSIDSTPGKGSVFTVTIPQFVVDKMTLQEKETKELEEAKKNVVKKHNQKFVAPTARILVIDDNKMNLKVIEGLLKKFQIQVVTAMSGKEGLATLESKDFDFVFMDHMMPEMDGIETLKRMREHDDEFYQKVPVIALTANAISGVRETFLKEGCVDFVEKPVRISVLEQVLLAHLPKEKIEAVGEEKEASKETIENKESKEEVPIGDLDMKTGIMYCGGRDKLVEILVGIYEGAADTRKYIQSAYENEDLPNYIIQVHALKSTMNSVGAMKLSAMAKELEFAGKDANLTLIHEKHDEMMEEYNRVVVMIGSAPEVKAQLADVSREKIDVDFQALTLISEQELEQYIAQFELAAYSMDGTKMKEILQILKQGRVGNIALGEQLEKIEKKVEQSDYLSANEAMQKIRETDR